MSIAPATILITGGSGMIGRRLTAVLRADGHEVRHLSRDPGNDPFAFRWDVDAGYVEPAALTRVDHIVHLAGAGIADERWTRNRVRELMDSRARSIRLLHQAVAGQGARPRTLVSAAGVGYYGAVTSDHVYTENDPAGNDTIARISDAWEAAVDTWRDTCRVVKLRTPIVLANAGALPRLATLVRWGLGAPLGTGRQWIPWVHLEDLVAIYLHALNNAHMHGAYNVTADHAVTNAELMRTLALELDRPYFIPRVPGFILRMALGERAVILLEGSRTSNARLLGTGFRFAFPDLHGALADLLQEKEPPGPA